MGSGLFDLFRAFEIEDMSLRARIENSDKLPPIFAHFIKCIKSIHVIVALKGGVARCPVLPPWFVLTVEARFRIKDEQG